MSHNNDNSGMIYIGGIVVIIIMVGFVIKILKAIMIELSELFVSIGKMAASFMTMAGQVALVLGLLSLGIAAIYAAWVFSKKYYQLVKDATAIKEQMENRFSDLHFEFESSFNRLNREAAREINKMRIELDKALKGTEVTPQLPEKPSQDLATIASPSNNEITPSDQPQIQDTPKDISNPF